MFSVQHSFKPERKNVNTDIELRVGDLLTNVEYLDNGWSIGFNVNTQQAGIFPRRNILPVHDATSAIFPPSAPKKRPVFVEDRLEEYTNSDEIVNWWKIIDINALTQAYKDVVYTERHQFRLLKGCVGFVAGLLLGALAYIGLQFALEYPPVVAGALAGFICLVLVVGLSFSTKCRAVVCLCIPTLATKSGRLVFSTLAISLLLAGPVTNITNNASELASVSSCVGELLANQTSFIRELAQKPYDDLIAGLKKTVEQVQNSVSFITKVLKPVQDVVDLLSDAQTAIHEELTQIQSQCRSSLSTAATRCEQEMRDASNRCRQFIEDASQSWECNAGGIGGRLDCESPDKFQSLQHCTQLVSPALCKPVTTVETVCDGLNIPINFLSFTENLEKVKQALSTNITLKDTVEGGVSTNVSKEEVVRSIKAELRQRTKVITDVFVWANWVLSLVVLLVVVHSFSYIRKYLRDDKHDNIYITDSFVQVDQNRSKKAKWSLLPLTPKERRRVADKRQCRLSGIEKKTFCTGFLPILLNIVGGMAIVAFDFLLYEAILLAKRHGEVKIDINENIDVGVSVAEGGLLSSFLDKLVGNLQLTSKIDHTIDSSVCLAQGSPPRWFPIIGLAAVYLLMVFTVLVQAYTLRLRHFMAGYFYPEREKDRVKYLHRKMLRQRVIMIKELKDILMVKRQENENKMAVKDMFDDLKAKCCCSHSKEEEECYICEEVALIDQLNWCSDCNSYFCNDCFHITLNNMCPCNPEVSLTYDHVTDSDFEEDVQEQIVSQYYSYVGNTRGSNESMAEEETSMNIPSSRNRRQNPREFFRQASNHRVSWR